MSLFNNKMHQTAMTVSLILPVCIKQQMVAHNDTHDVKNNLNV